MKERLEKLWHQQTEKDKRMLMIGAVVVCLYLIYACTYAPLKSHQKAYQERLKSDRQTLVWMRSVQHFAHTRKKSKEKPNASELLTFISQALPKTPFKSYLYQLQQTGDKNIQLSYDSVPYNFFLSWLSDLSESHQFSIEELRVEGLDKVGLVKLVLILQAYNG